MFIFKLVIPAIFFVTVHGVARFTNSQFNTVEVGKPFNITAWTRGKSNLGGSNFNDTSGNWYNWIPNENVPVDQNSLEIIDLDDQEPNYSLLFSIKGANASWVSSEDPLLDGSETPGSNPGDTSPPGSGGFSTAVKVTLRVAIPVVVFVVGTYIGLWLRNKRVKTRRGNHSLRTMSTDNTPTRYKSEHQNHSTPGVDATLNQASPTAWDDDFPTPPNNRSTASPSSGEDEIHASAERRYVSNNSRLQNNPESPTPKQRTVSAPVRETGVGVTRQSPTLLPNQLWDLSAGTPAQSRAELAQPQPRHELPHNQRNFSSPLPTSSNGSRQTERSNRDLYAGVTFGDSDDPDEIVAHLTAQRQKVRGEKERLMKLQELTAAEDDIERQIEAAGQKRC
ncbi:hypothetical protein L207DRAFT_611390 [Hyaloscypha variabilis F]|uniref:Mid2 domain-containing protein n=1 Tax=Hyaloscypha variabilis (strain UAMH 11265 / GT02V1 / F) TaxID=1149755 RepID=A0A2J6QYG0_HYAVF|nr:hypothetical protein L207DRAFT_611390 [Hyaloscypha variabilis F]